MCCISKENALALVHFPKLHPFAYDLQDLRLRDTQIGPQGRCRIFQKNPSKITLPLHRLIKKFLKIFQLHVNSIAIPTHPHPPPPQSQKINQCVPSEVSMDDEANSASKASCCYSKESGVTIFTTQLYSVVQVL